MNRKNCSEHQRKSFYRQEDYEEKVRIPIEPDKAIIKRRLVNNMEFERALLEDDLL